MTKSRLTPEDLSLWQAVADQTKRLQKTRPAPSPVNPKCDPATLNIPSPSKRAEAIAPQKPKPRVQKPALQMDRKTFDRMTRGKLLPEARIDLHGLTLDQAHPALIRFVQRAHASGKRLVLVITGKGKADPSLDFFVQQRGVLRKQVPVWLSTAPLRALVLEQRPAHISHGGAGALYVYLRRNR